MFVGWLVVLSHSARTLLTTGSTQRRHGGLRGLAVFLCCLTAARLNQSSSVPLPCSRAHHAPNPAGPSGTGLPCRRAAAAARYPLLQVWRMQCVLFGCGTGRLWNLA